MTTSNWIQLLLVAMVAGAFVSKTSHAVLSRVRTQDQTDAPHEWAKIGSSAGPDQRDAAQELASLIGLDESGVEVTFTDDHEVHCSIQAAPDELLELTEAADAAISQAFRARHCWTDALVVLRLEARPRTNVGQASTN